MKYNDNGEWKDIIVKATDTLPIGTEVDYNGTDVPDGWEEVGPNNLIAEITLKEPAAKMQLRDLNLEPGVYQIVIMEYSTTDTSAGHYLTINDINTNYFTQGIHSTGYNVDCFTSNKCLCLTNGWQSGTRLFFSSGIITYFNADWLGSQIISNTENRIITQGGYFRGTGMIPKINSLEVRVLDSDMIGVGSYIRLYKV